MEKLICYCAESGSLHLSLPDMEKHIALTEIQKRLVRDEATKRRLRHLDFANKAFAGRRMKNSVPFTAP